MPRLFCGILYRIFGLLGSHDMSPKCKQHIMLLFLEEGGVLNSPDSDGVKENDTGKPYVQLHLGNVAKGFFQS